MISEDFGAGELIAKHARDVFVVTDANGVTVWVNDAFVRCTGYAKHEIIGRKPGELLQGPGTDPRHRAALRKAIDERVPLRHQILNYTKAGEEYWVDIELSPVFGETGEVRYFVAVERDITANRLLEERNRDYIAVQKALNRQAIVSSTDCNGRIDFVNDHFCRVSGFARDELLGEDHRIVNSGQHRGSFFAAMWHQIKRGGTWHGELCNRAKDGALYWVDITVVPVSNDAGELQRFLSICFDITERKRIELDLQRLVGQDDLTGLGNRREFLAGLEALQQAPRRRNESGEALVLLLDMDRFKDINDTRGHPFGDAVLCGVGARLQGLVREGDSVARLGGDEFGVILREGPVQSAEIISTLARLIDELSAPMTIDGVELRPSFSIGAARYPEDGADPQMLLKNADIAMYAAKADGRGCARHFSANLEQSLAEQMALEQDLRQAIEERSLEVAWQPQVALQGEGLRGFEALARWHRNGTSVSPAIFVPLAERTGLIHDLGALLLRKVLNGVRELLDSGIDPGVVAINVSPIQLQSHSFYDDVRTMMVEYALDADRLEIEITETALMGPSIDVVRANVQKLHELGITIALDDFGTGYSSLTLLKQFPVDVLKIDRSFVSAVSDSPEDRKIVRAIIGLGRSLNMRLVGEGVEDEATGSELRLYGCTYGQGYHYAKPMPFAQVASFIDDTTVCAPMLVPTKVPAAASSSRA